MPGPASPSAPRTVRSSTSADERGSELGASRTRESTGVGRSIAIASAATFVAFLDTTVVNVALPDLRRDFSGASLVTLSWVVAIYGVAFAALLTPGGRLADALGRKAVFLAGFAGFTLASALCALAPSAAALIALRALQGVGAAFMIPAALGIVLAVAPPDRRIAAVGLWGATTSIAAAAGPALGGLLIDAFSWRAVFVINVPIGLVALWLGWRTLPALKGGRERLPDLLGSLLLGAGAGALLVALSETAQWGWLDGRTLGLAAGGAVALAIALRRAGRHPAPALEIGLWRNRDFAVANLAAAFYGLALFAWLLLCILFMTAQWGYSIVEAGLAATPGAFTSAAAAVVAGRAVDRRGPRAVVAAGALITAAAGVWVIAAMPEQSNFLGYWLPVGMLAGVGMGAATVGITGAAARALPPAQFAAGTGMSMTARQFGGAVGVAALATILASADPGLGGYRAVFALCTAAALVVLLIAAWLAPAPAPDRSSLQTPAPAEVTP